MLMLTIIIIATSLINVQGTRTLLAEDGNAPAKEMLTTDQILMDQFDLPQKTVRSLRENHCLDIIEYLPTSLLNEIAQYLRECGESEQAVIRQFIHNLFQILQQDGPNVRREYFPFLNGRSISNAFQILSSMFDMRLPPVFKTEIVRIQHFPSNQEEKALYLRPKGKHDQRLDVNGDRDSPDTIWKLHHVPRSVCRGHENCVRLQSMYFDRKSGNPSDTFIRKDNDNKQSGNIDCLGGTKDWSLYQIQQGDKDKDKGLIRLKSQFQDYKISVQLAQLDGHVSYEVLPSWEEREHPSELFKMHKISTQLYPGISANEVIPEIREQRQRHATKKMRISNMDNDDEAEDQEALHIEYWRIVKERVEQYESQSIPQQIESGRVSPFQLDGPAQPQQPEQPPAKPIVHEPDDMDIDGIDDALQVVGGNIWQGTRFGADSPRPGPQGHGPQGDGPDFSSILPNMYGHYGSHPPQSGDNYEQQQYHAMLEAEQRDAELAARLRQEDTTHEKSPELFQNVINVNEDVNRLGVNVAMAIKHYRSNRYLQFFSEPDQTGKFVEGVDCTAQCIKDYMAVWIPERCQAPDGSDPNGFYIKIRNAQMYHREDEKKRGEFISYLRFTDQGYVDLQGRGREWNILKVEWAPKEHPETHQVLNYFRFYSPKWNTYLAVDEQYKVFPMAKPTNPNEISDRTLWRLEGNIVGILFGPLMRGGR